MDIIIPYKGWNYLNFKPYFKPYIYKIHENFYLLIAFN